MDDQSLLPFKNALHTAIDYGSLDVVRTLLENGIDPNAGGHVLTDLDLPRHSPSGSSGPSERFNVKPASIQCEIDEETGFDIHDIYHYDTGITIAGFFCMSIIVVIFFFGCGDETMP